MTTVVYSNKLLMYTMRNIHIFELVDVLRCRVIQINFIAANQISASGQFQVTFSTMLPCSHQKTQE